MADPIGVPIPGRTLGYWPGNPLVLTFNWDASDATGGHTFTANIVVGSDVARPAQTFAATVGVVGQVITATWAAGVTPQIGPTATWQLFRDGIVVAAGQMLRLSPQDTATSPILTMLISGPPAIAITVSTGLTGPAASTEVFYSQITADTAAITIDTLNLDVIPGLSGTVPDLATPCYLHAQFNASHTVANAAVYGGVGLSSATIVTGLLAASFQLLNIIGSKATISVWARLPPHSPGTYQAFVLGDAGNTTIRAAAYYPSFFRGLTA